MDARVLPACARVSRQFALALLLGLTFNAWSSTGRGVEAAITAETGTGQFVEGTISGTVTAAAGGAPLAGAEVSIFAFDGSLETVATATASGIFTTAVPAGVYYAVASDNGFADQLFDGIACADACVPTSGTPIHVNPSLVTTGINFALLPAGGISGTVTSTANGLAVSGLPVDVFSSAGTPAGSTTTNGSGFYSFAGLPVGSYYVRTNGNTSLINEVYDNVMCVGCAVTFSGGTLVNVSANTTTPGIDFALDVGGRISGTITSEGSGTPLANVTVRVVNAAGNAMGSTTTDASGAFITPAVPTGTYHVFTSNTQGFLNEVYNNIPCPFTCAPVTGTAIAVTAGATTPGIDFALAAGGRITGVITSAVHGGGLPNVLAQVFHANGLPAGSVITDGAGHYSTFGLTDGTYFVRTFNRSGFVEELYDNIPCTGCNVTTGTPIVVAAGVTKSGIDFALERGGAIQGTVTNGANASPLSSVSVFVFASNGGFVKDAVTDASGAFAVTELPPGTYYARTVVTGSQYFRDELYEELPCTPSCTVTSGTPIVVTVGPAQGSIDFTLTPDAGSISGTVTNAVTGGPLGSIRIDLFTAAGAFAKMAVSLSNGTFNLAGLAPGTYYARTVVNPALPYVDELFEGQPCFPTCTVTSGTPIVVVHGATRTGTNFSLVANLVQNGRFASGTNNWTLFATPDLTYIVSQVVSGVFEYYRNPPPPGTTNQAVIFQNTNVAVAANTALTARFSLGNSSSVRKRISVLVIDGDFSDIAVCTFWIPAGTPLTAYRMHTHTTKAWTNAAIYFYAASAGSNGGFYRLDNVTLELAPGGATNETECVDPFVPPATPGGMPSAELLGNGDFNTGALTPWQTFGTISWQIASGVFEFIRNAGQPAGVVFQSTNQPMLASQIMSATFQLGNSSGVRKRVTVILHDSNFSDLSACTFWLAPGQPLSDYAVQTYTTQAWANATLAVYGATAGPDQWIRLDNASFKRTPAAAISGTNCLEPGAVPNHVLASVAGSDVPPLSNVAAAIGSVVVAPDVDLVMDLGAAIDGRVSLRSLLVGGDGAVAEVQVSTDGVNWVTVAVARPSDSWQTLNLDLREFAGQVITVRFVVTPAEADVRQPALWRIGSMTVR